MIVSDCCGAPNRGNGDTDYAEFGICPECKEHCEFYDDEEEIDDYLSEDEPMPTVMGTEIIGVFIEEPADLTHDQLQQLYHEDQEKKQAKTANYEEDWIDWKAEMKDFRYQFK